MESVFKVMSSMMSGTEEQHRLVASQFAPAAAAYGTSVTHTNKEALNRLVEILEPQPHEDALDIATGAGNLALALSPFVNSIVASDLTHAMLEETWRRAQEMGVHNLTVTFAAAEDLPFEDNQFDIVCVRTAPHHFADIKLAIAEMARVVKPSGRVLIVDTCSPDNPDQAREMNEIEKLRDPSHVWNYTPAQWREMLAEAGLNITFEEVNNHALGKRLDFNDWAARMNVSPELTKELEARFERKDSVVRDVLEVRREDGKLSFTLPEITILARPNC